MKFRSLIALGFALLSIAPVRADQSSACIATTGTVSGLTVVSAINSAFTAIISSHSGASAPTNPCGGVAIKGQVWLDTTAAKHVMKVYDGSAWVSLGVLDTANDAWVPPIGGGAGSIASAATTSLSTVPEGMVTITGTTGISSFGSGAINGGFKLLKFSGSLTLTHNLSNITLPGSANIVTQAGDSALVVYLGGTTWTVLAYNRANGHPLVTPGIGAVASLASAGTTDLGTVATNNVSITGTTTITSFGSSANTTNSLYSVTFTGALTLTHNGTSLILPGGASITTTAGDSALALYLGSGNWRVVSYVRPTGGLNGIPTQTGNAGKTMVTDGTTASWSSGPVIPARGSISAADSTPTVDAGSVNIASISIVSAGIYDITFTTSLASTNFQVMAITTGGVSTDTMPTRVTNKATSGFRITFRRTTDANPATSPSTFDFIVVGGL